jgi:nucleotidyltransferase substrate binding protein (TIGR01987 family)
MSVSIQEFEKALNSLEEVILMPKTDITRDAAIQRFEFCVELSWKTSKKIMGTTTSAPKQVIREMAQANYISDVQLWFDAIDKRNITSHTYNESLAEEVFTFIKKFFPHARDLLNNLKAV